MYGWWKSSEGKCYGKHMTFDNWYKCLIIWANHLLIMPTMEGSVKFAFDVRRKQAYFVRPCPLFVPSLYPVCP